jgi:glycogen debranching enzyme
MSEAMFDAQAGIRTFENGQQTYPDHEYYQTGDDQFWPISTVLCAEGMAAHGFREEARQVMQADLFAQRVYDSFIEHFIKNGEFLPLFEKSENSRNQTWTAASTLAASIALMNLSDLTGRDPSLEWLATYSNNSSRELAAA